MTDDILKQFDASEVKYTESKNKLREAKDMYEFVKAKVRTIFRTELTARGVKTTLQEIEDKLILQQGDPNSELGHSFIEYSIALAKKEILYTEKEALKRRYWDNKGLIGG